MLELFKGGHSTSFPYMASALYNHLSPRGGTYASSKEYVGLIHKFKIDNGRMWSRTQYGRASGSTSGLISPLQHQTLVFRVVPLDTVLSTEILRRENMLCSFVWK